MNLVLKLLHLIVTSLVLMVAPQSARPAQASLAQAETVFLAGDWSVRRDIDPMTDEPSCTALYQDRFDVQLTSNAFFVSLRGRGGVRGYQLRFNDEPSKALQLATDNEGQISVVMIKGRNFSKLIGSQRIRIQIITVLSSMINEDFNLEGINEVIGFLRSPEC